MARSLRPVTLILEARAFTLEEVNQAAAVADQTRTTAVFGRLFKWQKPISVLGIAST